MKKFLKKRIVPILKSKYFLTTLGLAVWIIFFDKNDLVSQRKLTEDLNNLKKERDYFQSEITKSEKDMMELRTNPENLEKFAREKYLMKKDNEDIFVIVEEQSDSSSVK